MNNNDRTPLVQGRALKFDSIEPWPDPVDGSELLGEIANTFRRHLVLPDDASADAATLWVVHANAHASAEHSPVLVFASPEMRCGKSTAQRIVSLLVPRPLPTGNITPAALYRCIEASTPTLLIDEADTFLSDDRNDLHGILNTGFARDGGYVLRTSGDHHEVRQFSTWCAKCIALIGTLKGTLVDRSIVILLRRRLPSEHAERLTEAARDSVRLLARKVARWVIDSGAALMNADPSMPTQLHDRASDAWRHLIAIADLAGGDWPARARSAALALSHSPEEEQVNGERLLRDIYTAFDDAGADRMRSRDLLDRLLALEDAPWARSEHGRPMTQHTLARRLRLFGVKPRHMSFDNKSLGGYDRVAFEDPWRRYVWAESQDAQGAQGAQGRGDERAA